MAALRWAGTTAGVLLVGVLAGCTGAGGPGAATTSAAPSATAAPALTEDAFARVVADYDERNNAAIAETTRTGDPRAWAGVDDEVLLDLDQFGTRLGAVGTTKPDVPSLEQTPVSLYAPVALQDGPAFVAGLVERRRTDAAAGEAEARPASVLQVWARGAADARWKQVLSVGLTAGASVPAPAAPGAPSTATEQDRASAAEAAGRVVRYLTTGRKPTGLTLDPVLTDLRAGTSLRNRKGVRHRLRVAYANDVEDQTRADGSVRVVRTREGALAFVSLAGQDAFTVSGAATMSWDEPYGTAVRQAGPRRELSRDIAVMVVIDLPDDGTPSVLTSGWGTTE